MRRLVLGLTMVLALISCQNSSKNIDDRVVATVYDKVLHQSDLQDILYPGISRSDSIVRTKAFIDNWIRRQLLIHQAEDNIDASELDFSEQIEDYRNSLIIYKYETVMIEKNLDTVVTDEDIAKYRKEGSIPEGMDDNAARSIILNMRKKELVEKMNNNLYSKAVKDKVFVIY